MADFKTALNLVLKNEGGFVFDKDDRGGETYKGIARNMNGKWDGWITVDLLKKHSTFPNNLNDDTELNDRVAQFYESQYWDKMQGDSITHQSVANSIFDFGVNAGVKSSCCLAQLVVGANPDGVIGPKTLEAINQFEEQLFFASFTLAKIARYIAITEKNPVNRKYFYGWIRRALGK